MLCVRTRCHLSNSPIRLQQTDAVLLSAKRTLHHGLYMHFVYCGTIVSICMSVCMYVGTCIVLGLIDGLPSANASEHCVHSCNSPQQSNKLLIPWLPRIVQTLGSTIGHHRAQPRHSKPRLHAEARLNTIHFHSRSKLSLLLLTTSAHWLGQCTHTHTHTHLV